MGQQTPEHLPKERPDDASTVLDALMAPLRPRASLGDDVKDVRKVLVVLALLVTSNGVGDFFGRLVESALGNGPVSTGGALLADFTVFFATLPLSGAVTVLTLLGVRGHLQGSWNATRIVAGVLVVSLVVGYLLGLGGVSGDTIGQFLRIYNSFPKNGGIAYLLALYIILSVAGAYLQLYGAWVFFLGIVFGFVGGWAVGTKLLPHFGGRSALLASQARTVFENLVPSRLRTKAPLLAALLLLIILLGGGLLLHALTGTTGATVGQATPTTTPTPIPPTGLLGQYYRSRRIDCCVPLPDDLFGAPLFSRVDPQIDIHSGNGQYPDLRLAGGAYAIRWTGQIRSRYSETYTFTTQSDDGVRVWVNGQLLIDDWKTHAEVTDTASMALAARQLYDIKIEYYENDVSGAVMVLQWQSASQQLEVVPASQLYPARAT